MKFQLNYGLKIPTNIQYKMANIGLTIISDTSVETMDAAFARLKSWVETKTLIEEERYRKLWEESKPR